MSRSLHITWRKLREERRWDYDGDSKRERVSRLKNDMIRKRTVKGISQKSRERKELGAEGISTPLIVNSSVSEFEHFPASCDDIENVIECL